MPNGKPLVRQAKDRLNEITRLGKRSAGIMPPSVYLIAWVGQAAGQCRRLPGDLVGLVLRNDRSLSGLARDEMRRLCVDVVVGAVSIGSFELSR